MLQARDLRLYLFSFVSAIVTALVFWGCVGKHRENYLIVGMEPTYPPFEYLDEKGNPTGIEVEMAQDLAKSMDKELRIEQIPFDGLVTALKSGKIDLIISSLTDQPERRKSIDFSDPYINTGLAILANVGSNIHSVEDLVRPGIRIVTKSGTTGHDYVEAHFPKAQKMVLPSETNCALEVSQGKADAFIYDQFSIYRHHQRYPKTTVAILKPIEGENWAIGIRKGNDALREKVNTFLKKFLKEGRLKELELKYLKGIPADEFKEMNTPLSLRNFQNQPQTLPTIEGMIFTGE